MADLQDYFIFTKSYSFTFGLLFILSMIDLRLVEVLFSNLINAQEDKDVRLATFIVNLREGVTELLKVFAIFFTDRYMKRIGAVVLFNVIHIVGLVMLYMFEDSKTRKTNDLIIATVTISLGKTGFVLLIGFIGDQFREPYEDDEDGTIRLTLGWWVFPWALSAIIAPFFRLPVTTSIVLLTTLLVVALVIFWVGEECLVDYKEKLDRGVVYGHREEEEKLSVQEVLHTILAWLSLILSTIVLSAGTTFFLQQAENINKGFPAVTFIIFRHIVNVLVSVLFSKRGRNLFTHLVVGMLFSFSSSVFAFWTEAYPYGIWVLTPQYILLGVAEGLARDAFEGYFNDRIQKMIRKKWVRYVIQFIIALGKFFGYAVLSTILYVSAWDASDLRSYYKLLMIASSVSLLVLLYLRILEVPVRPKGLSGGIFSPAGGQTIVAAVLGVEVEKGKESDEEEELSPDEEEHELSPNPTHH